MVNNFDRNRDRTFSAVSDPLSDAAAWLAACHRFWDGLLSALDNYLSKLETESADDSALARL
jgi:hypothetical protein